MSCAQPTLTAMHSVSSGDLKVDNEIRACDTLKVFGGLRSGLLAGQGRPSRLIVLVARQSLLARARCGGALS